MKLGKLMLEPACIYFTSPTGNHLPVLGTFNAKASLDHCTWVCEIRLNISSLLCLNLLDKTALLQLEGNTCTDDVHAILEGDQPDQMLSQACKQLCTEFLKLFKPKTGCLKDY